jgi:hypothetical protein
MHLYEFDFLSAIMKILIQNRSSWKLGLMNHCNLGFQTSLNLTWSQITLLTRYLNVIKLIYVDCIYDHINPRYISHSSDILSIRFKHTRILRFFGLYKKYLKILDTKANFQAFVFL